MIFLCAGRLFCWLAALSGGVRTVWNESLSLLTFNSAVVAMRSGEEENSVGSGSVGAGGEGKTVTSAAAAGESEAGLVQGHAADFSHIDEGSTSSSSKPHGGLGLFANAWKAAQKLASDIGAGDMLHDMKSQMNKVKAQQYGDKLKLVETTEEVETAMAYIKESKIKYAHLLSVLQDMAVENAKIAGPLRRVGAAFVKCATINERVARDLATSGKESFFKETPTYQQDLNEALMVTSGWCGSGVDCGCCEVEGKSETGLAGAMLYQADRSQSMYTTHETIDASRANFEQVTRAEQEGGERAWRWRGVGVTK
eukprot:342506-Hanusia_phi.AAC.3